MPRSSLFSRLRGGLLSQVVGGTPNAGLFVLADLAGTHFARRIPDPHASDRNGIENQRAAQRNQHEPADLVTQHVACPRRYPWPDERLPGSRGTD